MFLILGACLHCKLLVDQVRHLIQVQGLAVFWTDTSSVVPHSPSSWVVAGVSLMIQLCPRLRLLVVIGHLDHASRTRVSVVSQPHISQPRILVVLSTASASRTLGHVSRLYSQPRVSATFLAVHLGRTLGYVSRSCSRPLVLANRRCHSTAI